MCSGEIRNEIKLSWLGIINNIVIYIILFTSHTHEQQ